MNTTQIIILAAGQGTRLKPYTDDRPKCMVELAGKPLLAHQIVALNAAGLTNITVVTGYRKDHIERLGLATVYNPEFANTNMVASLMSGSHLLDGRNDVLILYSDIVYQPGIIKALLEAPDALATTVDRQWLRLWQLRGDDPIKDAETMRLNPDGTIRELGKKPKSLSEIEGQYMGLIKVRADFALQFKDIYNQMDRQAIYDGKTFPNMFMTSFLQYLIDAGHPIKAVLINGGWLEVDTVRDLQLFNDLERQGKLKDYCRLEGA
jgi:L-glutamine-phosphate cytidylyltransferase